MLSKFELKQAQASKVLGYLGLKGFRHVLAPSAVIHGLPRSPRSPGPLPQQPLDPPHLRLQNQWGQEEFGTDMTVSCHMYRVSGLRWAALPSLGDGTPFQFVFVLLWGFWADSSLPSMSRWRRLEGCLFVKQGARANPLPCLCTDRPRRSTQPGGLGAAAGRRAITTPYGDILHS